MAQQSTEYTNSATKQVGEEKSERKPTTLLRG